MGAGPGQGLPMETEHQGMGPLPIPDTALLKTMNHEATLDLLNLLVRQMPGMVAVLDCASFTHVAASPAYTSLLLHGPAEGYPVCELPAPFAGRLKAALQDISASGVAIPLLPITFSPPGAPAERYFHVICTPLLLDNPARLALITLEEITELTRLQRRLAEVAEIHRRTMTLFRQMAELLDDGVFICDAAGVVTFANAPMLRLAEEAGSPLIGLPFTSFIERLQPHSADGMPLDLASIPGVRVLRGEPAASMVIGLRIPGSNHERFIRSLALPVHDTQGRLHSVIVIWIDQNPSVEAERQKDAFLAIVGHELRTPLSALIGYVQLYERRLERAPTDRSQDLAMVRTISEQTARLVRLADDLLDLSRLTRGTLELHYAPCDIIALARRIITTHQITAPDHRLALHHHEASIVGVWDERRLEQVLNNLVSNAIKYSPQGGPVEVSVFREGKLVRISVRDEGIGVPEAQQHRLFERFYRAENAVLANFGGLGLGLSIARELITRHGGEIGVISQEGKGSTFWFTLPLLSSSPIPT
jgi:signal transduction histidine kinase